MTNWPVNINSLALDVPTILLSLWVPPQAGIKPRFTSGCEYLALSEEIRISHANASSLPPPYAAPLIAAITGLEKLANFEKTCCPKLRTAIRSFGSVIVAKDFISAPAQNALLPPPVTTTPNIVSFFSNSSIALSKAFNTSEFKALTGG